MSHGGTVDWTSRPLINGTRQAATAVRNHGHPNQHLHASVECTRRAELGAEPLNTRLARSAPASQRSSCPPERFNAPRRFAGFGRAGRTGPSYFQIGVENAP